MTNTTDSDGPTRIEPTNEDAPRSPHPDDLWERKGPEDEKPDASPISDPPDHGVDYYHRLIDLDNCYYTYMMSGSILQFHWQGELTDIDEFRTALYQVYNAAYISDLSAADYRPKAFLSFVSDTFSEEVKDTLYSKLVTKPGKSHKRVKHPDRVQRIADTIHYAAALGCEHRTKLGRTRRSKDAVLKSILPEPARDPSN